MNLLLDGLQALPKSNEEYVARTRGELEQLVRFFRGLHIIELTDGTEPWKHAQISAHLCRRDACQTGRFFRIHQTCAFKRRR